MKSKRKDVAEASSFISPSVFFLLILHVALKKPSPKQAATIQDTQNRTSLVCTLNAGERESERERGRASERDGGREREREKRCLYAYSFL